MYVSKSNRGPLAQRMYVFQRDADGRIIPYAEWPVSTGREKVELHKERKIRTITPEGIFALEPEALSRALLVARHGTARRCTTRCSTT